MKTEKKEYAVWEELGIGNDFLFGKVMQDVELCKELLQRILPELQIDRVAYPSCKKASDAFGKGRHVYTFENLCKEDKSISLNDGTTKIFLNAAGEMDDISKELRAFLDYVAGKKTEDAFVGKLEEAVKQAKKNREWRHEYMTLLMRDQENMEKGIEQGIEKGIEQGLKKGKIYGAVSTYKELGLSDSEILERLQKKYQITESEAEKYMQDM